MTQLTIQLSRDSFNTPWGFRLQGGKDVGQVLSVQRVFSNSPAEGELQRGDLILAIGGRNCSELSHKQALDLIKHGGGQIQLVIQRPAPGQLSSPISIKPQRPRAPSLQVDKVRENETPATEAFLKYRMDRLQMLKNGEILNGTKHLSPVYHPTNPTGPSRAAPKSAGVPHVTNPCYNPHFFQQYHNPKPSPNRAPAWATQSNDPKKAKLARLGGGGKDLGVDYGALYGTVPRRRRHSTQLSSSGPQLQSAGAHPARVVSLSHLGGGGVEFGTNYCTLPRRHKSQPPHSQQPTTSYGFQPKKVTLSNFGGGGPSFGTDYSGGGAYRPSVSQPVHVHTGPKSPGHNVEMLNKVQESLDNISLSPRSPDFGYQAPAFPASPTSGGQYVSTGVRLDMEREREQQRQQYMREHPPYVPTSARIDQQMAAQGKSLSPRSPGATSSGGFSHKPRQNPDAQDGGPAWSSTLKPTSVKPWDADLDYVPNQHQAPVSSGFQPGHMAPSAASYSPNVPAPAQGRDEEDGPKVVHLQYNSPMGLYSRNNVQETYAGQTKALAESGALSPGGSYTPQNQGAKGERDWSQSAVYQMIHGGGGSRGGPQQQQQQYRPSPYQPQVQSYQQTFQPGLEEFGSSEF
ncbi:hypothetical protein ACOMHN_063672 [Nucella lapillus]